MRGGAVIDNGNDACTERPVVGLAAERDLFRPDGDQHGLANGLADDARVDAGRAKIDSGDAVAGLRDPPAQNITHPHEPRDEFRARRVEHLARRAELFDDAVVHHRDRIGHRQRFVLVMRHENGGNAGLALQVPDFGLHLFSELLVQRAQGLVEQEYGGVQHQRPCQRHALLLAARKLVGIAPLEVAELDECQGLADLALHRTPVDATHAQAERHVVGDRQMWEQREILKHHAEIASVGRQRRYLPAPDKDVAPIGPLEARDDAQGRRLAAATRAKQ